MHCLPGADMRWEAGWRRVAGRPETPPIPAHRLAPLDRARIEMRSSARAGRHGTRPRNSGAYDDAPVRHRSIAVARIVHVEPRIGRRRIRFVDDRRVEPVEQEAALAEVRGEQARTRRRPACRSRPAARRRRTAPAGADPPGPSPPARGRRRTTTRRRSCRAAPPAGSRASRSHAIVPATSSSTRSCSMSASLFR